MASPVILLAYVLLSLAHPSFQQGPDIPGRIDEFVEDLLECYDIPAATVGAVKDDQIIVAKGYGVRDLDTEEPTRDRDLFVIASVTKQFAATVVGHVLKKHNLTWDTPIRDILGDWFYWKDPYRTAKVTVRDALAHRTGLPRNDPMRIYNFTKREMFERLRHLDTTAAIRTRYKYNNLMYGLAGYVAETLEGKSWEDLAREIIFQPLGMSDTTFVHQSRDRWGDYATPYRLYLGLPREVSLELPALMYQTISAQGAISSHAGDMSRWMMAQLSGGRNENGTQVLDPEVIQDTYAINMPIGGTPSYSRPIDPVTFTTGESYGLGFQKGYHRGYSLVSHSGSMVYLSLLTMLKDMDIGVFSSVSLGVSNRFRTNVHAFVMDLLLGKEPFLNSSTACPGGIYGGDGDELYPTDEDEEVYHDIQDNFDYDPSRERPLDEANTVGVYTSLAYGSVTVYRNSTDDELYMSYGPLIKWILINLGDDLTYTGQGVEPYWSYGIQWVEFKDCDSQPCASVDISFEPEAPPTFKRIPDEVPPPNPPCPSQ